MADPGSKIDEYPFTMQIVTPDGGNFYEVSSSNLGPLQPVTDEMKKLIDINVNLAHTPWKDRAALTLCGTFFVNLSLYRPKQ